MRRGVLRAKVFGVLLLPFLFVLLTTESDSFWTKKRIQRFLRAVLFEFLL